LVVSSQNRVTNTTLGFEGPRFHACHQKQDVNETPHSATSFPQLPIGAFALKATKA
jgi:hypothetical protein